MQVRSVQCTSTLQQSRIQHVGWQSSTPLWDDLYIQRLQRLVQQLAIEQHVEVLQMRSTTSASHVLT
jgi:hypothetical protein